MHLTTLVVCCVSQGDIQYTERKANEGVDLPLIRQGQYFNTDHKYLYYAKGAA